MPTIGFDNRAVDVTGCKPRKLRLGDWYCEPSTWAKAMEMTAKSMLGSVNHRDQLLKTIHSINGIGAVSATLRRPVKLEANLWLEANKSAQDSLRTIVALLEAAEFPLEKASVEYESDSQQGKEETEASPPPKAENEAAALSPILHLKEHKEKSAKGAVEKIGAYAKREIYAALAEGRVPDDDFAKLRTLEGTKELLGVSLTTCPMFSLSPMTRRDGRHGCWSDAASRNGERVYVNSQWYEEHRSKLEKLLARWSVVKPQGESTVQLLDSSPTARQFYGKVLTTGYDKNLAELLEAEFPNGVRPGSIIDRNKIRRAYLQWFDEELPPNFDFESILPRVGLLHDGKVFAKPSERGKWRRIIDGIVAQGNTICTFAKAMERHASELMAAGISSAAMLRDVMAETAAADFEIGEVCFAPKGFTCDIAEALVAASDYDSPVFDVATLAAKFPYIGEDTIRETLRDDPRFLRNDGNSFAYAERLLFDEVEADTTLRACEAEVESYGFYSLSKAEFGASRAMNDGDVAEPAMRREFFNRYLSNRFDLKGQIVGARGADADAQAPLRAYCRGRAEASLAEAEAIAAECNIAQYLAIQILHEEMVRVDLERFVAPELIRFDAAATDAAIGALATGVATPFGEFERFDAFPAVAGFAWNEYLFEAYLRRGEGHFRLLKQSVVAREPCGVVVAAATAQSGDGAGAAAITAFARAATDAGVEPEPDAVGGFLVSSRCILRRSAALVGAVTAAMRRMQPIGGNS